jgi:hypothetical protein|tara:strand:- start:453 stop:692 length:240 start_codon:yes stop_codon:yes gene_type:complete
MLAPIPAGIPQYAKGGPIPQGPLPGAIIMNPVDTRTPQEKQKEELAKYGALIGLMGNVAGMIPGLKPLQYAGDVFNLIT